MYTFSCICIYDIIILRNRWIDYDSYYTLYSHVRNCVIRQHMYNYQFCLLPHKYSIPNATPSHHFSLLLFAIFPLQKVLLASHLLIVLSLVTSFQIFLFIIFLDSNRLWSMFPLWRIYLESAQMHKYNASQQKTISPYLYIPLLYHLPILNHCLTKKTHQN